MSGGAHVFRAALLVGTMALQSLPAFGQERAIADIRITADRNEASIVIEFACEMRFVADTAISGGALLEIRMAPFDACRQRGIGSAITTESYRPLGAEQAHLAEVEYSALGLGDSLVMLTFDQTVDYRMRQGATPREVEILIDLATLDVAVPDREPISVRVVEPAVTADYMINLQSTREPATAEAIASARASSSAKLYVSQVRVDGVLWHRLRLGFFASEQEAAAALPALSPAFPRAWIGRAEPAEIGLALESELPVGAGVTTLTTADLEAETSAQGLTLGSDEVAAMMADARSKMLASDNRAAIEIYLKLVRTPGEHRGEAIEFLGLAYERSGDIMRARAEYERYLREFPDGSNRQRVEQRLNSVVAVLETPPEALRASAPGGASPWDWSAAFSQYYRRDDNRFDQDQPELTTLSALMTDADFSLSRSGDRLDLGARVSLNHFHDLLEPSQGGRGDQNRVAYAYLDLAAPGQRWDLRLGRQSLHSFGVLGRFDGAHFSLGIGQDKRLHVTQGHPVESTRDSVVTDREFSGIAAEFLDVVGAWDLSAFVNRQTIEGIDARLGVGTEARYFDDRRTLTAMLDYDVDFSELNLVLMLGTWRLPNRLTVSALVDQRKSPLLTTRNALIGQPVETIEEMLLVWTEDEVRALARDRTAESQTVTLGVAAPLGERLQLNFDVTQSEIDGTVASGGVAALPGMGAQTYYSTSLVATGLFAGSDVNIWNLRIGEAESFETQLLTWDARFPIGRHVRINPRIRLVHWQSVADGRERNVVAPALRLLISTRNRFRLEAEVGRDHTLRRVAGTEQQADSRYFNFGYLASF